jgi:hypothetical protein
LLRLEVAPLVVDGRPESCQKLGLWLLLETNADDEAKLLFEPKSGLTPPTGLEVTANPPGRKCGEFAIEIAVDILKGVIAVLGHVGSIIFGLSPQECSLFGNLSGLVRLSG